MKPSIHSLAHQTMQEWVLAKEQDIPCRSNLGMALP